MMEACLDNAIERDAVSQSDNRMKYICIGTPARALWDFLEAAKLDSWEQEPEGEGRWLSREFPLGACFKRLANADGSPATNGLSCTIWIPRPSTTRTPKK